MLQMYVAVFLSDSNNQAASEILMQVAFFWVVVTSVFPPFCKILRKRG